MKKNWKLFLTAGCAGAIFLTGCQTDGGNQTRQETETTAAKAEESETEDSKAEEPKTEESEAEESKTDESETEEEKKADTDGRVITDHAGRQVELPDEIDRIAVTDTLPLPSVLSLFLGSADEIVGISPVSMSAAESGLLGELYPELLNADTEFFANSELNIEELLALEPDIVFYNAGSTAIEEALDNAGLTGIAVSVTKWDFDAAETYKQWLKLLEDIFPEREGVAKQAALYCDQAAEEIQEKTGGLTDEERQRVFFLFNYSEAGIVTSGERFWGQYWCDAAGAVNVSKDVPAEKSNAIVNMEQIYAWDPEVIFISNFTSAQPEDLYENTIGDYDWSGISAVDEQRVYKMPLGAYRTFTPGADTPGTMLWIAKQIYPELFDSVDLVQRTQEYYQSVFGVTLTDEQAESIYGASADHAE